MSAATLHTDSDAIDLRELAAVLRRGRRWIAGGLAAGIALGLLATWLLRPSYEATAVVVLRNSDASSAALSRLGGGLGGLAGSLPIGLESGLETEIEILSSRFLAGEVVDSLLLQATVLSPRGRSTTSILESARFEAGAEEAEYRFTRAGAGYRVEGPGVATTVRPGEAVELPSGVLTLRRADLPDEFTLEVVDREEAIDRLVDRLEIENTAGEVASLVFRAGDRATAAAVPNALIREYLARRRTTDRGVNQRRYEFLREQVDSIGVELAAAESALRAHQERSGVLDPELTGEAELERATALRKELEAVEVEIRALEELVRDGDTGRLAPRRIAAYPTFLRNPAINDVLSRLLELDTERGILLQRRTEADPEVVALTENVEYLENQLVSLSRAYLTGLVRQRESLGAELARMRAEVAGLPGQAETSLRLQREVKRLTETLIALQAQLVQSRLAAIGEGGDVRQVDVAVPPREPEFPKWWLNLAVGIFGGLIVGVAGAFSRAYLSPTVREPRDAELAAGVPALVLRAGSPLLLGRLEEVRGVLVLPLGKGADASGVARRIVTAAAYRGREAALIDLGRASGPRPAPAREVAVVGGAARGAMLLPAATDAGFPVFRPTGEDGQGGPAALRTAVGELEQRYSPVVVALAGLEEPVAEALMTEEWTAVLVGRCGMLSREELQTTAETLRRAGVRVAGVVLHDGDVNDGRHP